MVSERAKIVGECLKKHPEQKFTDREIADWIFKNYPDYCRKKLANSRVLNTEKELLEQIRAEVGLVVKSLQRNHPEVKTTEDSPRKHYFTESAGSAEIAQAESNQVSSVSRTNKVLSSPRVNEAPPASNTNGSRLLERHLYPKLSEFLWSEHKNLQYAY